MIGPETGFSQQPVFDDFFQLPEQAIMLSGMRRQARQDAALKELDFFDTIDDNMNILQKDRPVYRAASQAIEARADHIAGMDLTSPEGRAALARFKREVQSLYGPSGPMTIFSNRYDSVQKLIEQADDTIKDPARRNMTVNSINIPDLSQDIFNGNIPGQASFGVPLGPEISDQDFMSMANQVIDNIGSIEYVDPESGQISTFEGTSLEDIYVGLRQGTITEKHAQRIYETLTGSLLESPDVLMDASLDLMARGMATDYAQAQRLARYNIHERLTSLARGSASLSLEGDMDLYRISQYPDGSGGADGDGTRLLTFPGEYSAESRVTSTDLFGADYVIGSDGTLSRRKESTHYEDGMSDNYIAGLSPGAAGGSKEVKTYTNEPLTEEEVQHFENIRNMYGWQIPLEDVPNRIAEEANRLKVQASEFILPASIRGVNDTRDMYSAMTLGTIDNLFNQPFSAFDSNKKRHEELNKKGTMSDVLKTFGIKSPSEWQAALEKDPNAKVHAHFKGITVTADQVGFGLEFQKRDGRKIKTTTVIVSGNNEMQERMRPLSMIHQGLNESTVLRALTEQRPVQIGEFYNPAINANEPLILIPDANPYTQQVTFGIQVTRADGEKDVLSYSDFSKALTEQLLLK